MNITPDISMGNILTIVVAIAVPSIAFIVSLIVLRVTVRLEKTRTDEKFDEVDVRIDKLGAEIKGVRTGFEGGIEKVQERLGEMSTVLNGMDTKVAILFDRDERPTKPARAPRAPRA